MSISISTHQRKGVTARRRPLAGVLAILATIGVLSAVNPTAASAAVAVNTAPSSAPLAAAPAGRLAVNGCFQTAGNAACDLYAMTSTATVLGNPVPIWGFSTSSTFNSATAPGPVLVVNQGDVVTVTLHNQLAGQAVSLAFPGQASGPISGTAGDDTVGITSGTKTYTFTASRAGTFLYEAGHTANGTRQVAMGLAGALVVLPADGTAYGALATAYATTYDDDAVVVLSEIDPALNADPANFDMRNFQPKYRLINGKPYPASDPISTNQGHKVLLRFVNVGSETHSMSTLGADQIQIAQGGHPLKYAEPLVTETIEPGSTGDTLVTMPTGPEAKIALFDASEHLDNNAQTTADPLQFAFGGMLTFLDTAAPPPALDGVGPVSSHIALSPNPSNGLAAVTVTADLSDATTGGSNVSQAEFVIDDAVTTGVGFGTPMTGAFGTVDVTGATGTISVAALAALDAGKHQVFVRALDSAGNWGVIGSAILNLPKTGPQTTAGTITEIPANGQSAVDVSATGDDTAAGGTITAAEYFVDAVGANGSGTALTLNRTASVVSEDVTISASAVHALGEGLHHIFVHSLDSLGLWGPTLDIELPVDLTGPTVDAASVGPNPTNGVITDKGNPGNLVVSASITDRDAGNALQNSLKDAEAFLDPTVPNPPVGTGLQLIAVDGLMDGTTESVYGLIPISQIRGLTDGTHHVYVRGQDSAGNWGSLFAVNLIVDKTAPALGTLAVAPNPTNGAPTVTLTAPVTDASLISAAEYWFGTTDPGVGLGSAPVSLSVTAGVSTTTVSLAGVTAGPQTINLRVKDLAGNWSNVRSVSFTVVRPNAIFSDTFNSLSAWSASTGGVSVLASAGIPVGGTNLGLQVRLPGGPTNRVSYVTDNTPVNETTYHAQFSFNRNTLTSGNNAATVLTLFDARNATNGQVFALQYRLNAGNPQVRMVFARTTGGTLTGAWYTLTAGAHTLRVDWVAATGGSLRLSVDGTSRSLQNGNTSSLRIDSARLGVVAGVTTAATGSTAGIAYFDSFVSTRNTLP